MVLAVGVPAIALVPLAASGEPKPAAKSAERSEKYDPDNVIAISQFMETIVKGSTLYAAKDTTNAIDTFKKAIQLAPKNPLGHYMLAEAYLGSGNLPEAEAAIKDALEASDPKNPALRSRVLFLAADIHERNKRWDQAKLAWQAYAEHAAKVGPDAGLSPQTSVERLKAIQKVLEMEKAYAAVRERIVTERDAGKKK